MRKNVLFVTLDQWRGDAMSCAGSVVQTPAVEALARDGVAFRSHFTVAAPCGPARASLLTGLYQHTHRSVRNGVPLNVAHQTIAQVFREAGYDPLLFGFTDTTLDPSILEPGDPGLQTSASMAPGFREGFHLPGDAWPWVEWLRSRGYAAPVAPSSPRDIWRPAFSRVQIDASPTIYSAGESETAFLTDKVIAYLGAAATGWFAHVSYFRPHHPYIAPAPFNQMYDPTAIKAPLPDADLRVNGRLHPWLEAQIARQQSGAAPVQDGIALASCGPREIAQLRATYYGSISECDAHIGRLIDTLKAKGAYESTLIVVTSDHGDMLGDYGLWAAESCLPQAFHVPLIIRDPQTDPQNRGRVVDAFTESVDVMPTILDCADLSVPFHLDGRSLKPFLAGRTPDDWRSAAHWELDFRDTTTAPGLQTVLGLPARASNLCARFDGQELYVHFAGMDPILLTVSAGRLSAVDPAQRAADIARGANHLLGWRMQSDDRRLTNLFVDRHGVHQSAR